MPPRRIEVDLTSVCVHRGTVQLPYRLQGVFEAGEVAARIASEGRTLDLEFRPPRELSGLRSFFEAHELRPNDRIALIIDADGLTLEAVKRERARAPAGASVASKPGRPSGEAAPVAPDPGPARRGPGGRTVTVGAPATRAADAARTARERLRTGAEVARLEHPPGEVAPEAGRGPRARALHAPRTDARAAPTRGPAPDAAATGGRDVSVRPAAVPRWEPLDVTAPPSGWTEPSQVGQTAQQEAHANGRVVVREVRRREAAGAGEDEAPAAAIRADDAGTAAGERAPRADAPAGAPGPRSRPESERPEPPVEGRGIDLFGLRRRLGFGGRRARGGPDARWPVGSGADNFGGGSWAGEDEAAGDDPLTPEAFVPSAETAPRPWMQAPAGEAAEVAPDVPEHTQAPRRRAPAGAGPGRSPGAEPAEAVEGAAMKSAAGRGSGAGAGALPEDDRALIQAYLARPSVPAIVRTERVAETLGLSVERAERALDRIAEHAERVTRIRAGAYMVRQKQEA